MTEAHDSSFSFTWGLELLDELGFTKVYNFMLRRYARLGLSRLEMLCLIHLASYHYESPTGESRPSLVTIAKQMGYSHRRHVSRLVSGLEKKGMISVTRRPGETSIYNARRFAQATFALLMKDDEDIQDVGGRAQNSTTSSAQNSTTPVLKIAREEEKKDSSEEKEETGNADSRRIPTKVVGGDPEIRARDERPKRVITGTGDSQRDHVDSADAGVSAVQASELVARAMYQVLTPHLEYPDGRTKRGREARRSAEIAADRVLERIGREHYQQALDACYLLLTEPTKKEEDWIGQINSVYGLIDMISKRVNQLRYTAERRAAAIEMNRQMLERRAYEIGIDPGLDTESATVVTAQASVIALDEDCVEIWRQTKADLELTMARATYDTWLRDAVLLDVTEDGRFIVGVGSQGAVDWLESKLNPVVRRSLALIADHPIEISFVLKDGAQDED